MHTLGARLADIFAARQVNQVQLPSERRAALLLLLAHLDQEHAVAARRVLVQVCTRNKPTTLVCQVRLARGQP